MPPDRTNWPTVAFGLALAWFAAFQMFKLPPVLPLLLQLIAKPVQCLRGLTLPLGLLRLVRDPLQASRAMRVMSLTTGLALLTWTIGSSLAREEGDTLAMGIVHAFRLNSVMLVLFGVIVFFLVLLFGARGGGV